jgi:hypothetical protein
LITRCDQEIEEQWQNFDRQLPPDAPALPPEAYPHTRRKNEFHFDMRSELYRIFGVDLTAIPSINALTAYTLLAEVGTDGSKFRNIHAFASWACFCPHNKKSGGKVLSAKTRRSVNRVNRALRLAAQTLKRSTSFWASFIARCAPVWEGLPGSPLPPTNWPASFFTWLPPDEPMTKAFLPPKSHASASIWKAASGARPLSWDTH